MLTPSYTMTAAAVNPSTNQYLTPRILSFYRWIIKLSKKKGFCWAKNSTLAFGQGVDDATITRWVSRLQAAGWVRCEQIPGYRRHIYPLHPRPTSLQPVPIHPEALTTPHQAIFTEPAAVNTPSNNPPPQLENAEGVAEGLRGVSPSVPYINNKALHNNTRVTTVTPTSAAEAEPESDVVAVLVEQGVSKRVAVALITEHGAEAVTEQVEALPHRKADDRAAVLVAAIKGGWSLPQRLRAARDKAREESARRARAAAAHAQKLQRDQEQSGLEQRAAALSSQARAALVARAQAQVAQDYPVVWQRGPQKIGCQALIRAAVLQLLATQEQPPPVLDQAALNPH